jgi:hypothetical protein
MGGVDRASVCRGAVQVPKQHGAMSLRHLPEGSTMDA